MLEKLDNLYFYVVPAARLLLWCANDVDVMPQCTTSSTETERQFFYRYCGIFKNIFFYRIRKFVCKTHFLQFSKHPSPDKSQLLILIDGFKKKQKFWQSDFQLVNRNWCCDAMTKEEILLSGFNHLH